MKRIRIIGLALVAVFAFGAVAATSALAQPEFVRCAKVAAGEPSSWEAGCITKKASGGYAKVSAGPGTCVKVAPGEPSSWSNATCTTKKTGTGEYLKVGAAGKLKFADSSEVQTLYAPGVIIICKKSKSTGEITGNTTVGNVVVTFEECEAEVIATKVKCKVHSPVLGAPETITTNKLHGELGTTTVGTLVGEALAPETPETFVEIEGTCITKTKVTGSVIGEVTPINTLQTTGKLIFRTEPAKSTKQQIKKCTGGTVIILCNGESDILAAFGGTSAIESTDTITFEEAIEVT